MGRPVASRTLTTAETLGDALWSMLAMSIGDAVAFLGDDGKTRRERGEPDGCDGDQCFPERQRLSPTS